jgi:hypothetical protein
VPETNRYRTRYSKLDWPRMDKNGRMSTDVGIKFNKIQHRRHHGPSMILYSQTATLADALMGSIVELPFACKLLTVMGTVQTAPSGDFTFDILEDANSIFHATSVPIILSGETTGPERRPDRRSFQKGTQLQVEVLVANGAVGPLHVAFCIVPGYED